MTSKLDLFNRLQAGPFVQWLQDGRWLSAPVAPTSLALAADSVHAAYLFESRQMVAGQVVADGVLTAIGNDMATLLVEAGAPAGARWVKRSLQIEFIAAPLTGDVMVSSDGAPIDWSQAGDRVVTVEGRNADGTPIFRADLTVGIIPAA